MEFAKISIYSRSLQNTKTIMTKTLHKKLKNCFLILPFLLMHFIGYSQAGTAVTMTLQNMVQTAPNVLEYDVMLTNTGTTTLALRGYSCGINHAAGLNGTGTLSHTFVSRDASLATLPAVTPGYTASNNHLRFTTLNALPGNEVNLTVGTPYRLATMRITNTVNFPTDFNTGFTLQTLTAAGKTQCIATCIVTPPGTNYAINGTLNTPLANTIQGLTGTVTTPIFFVNPSAPFAANVNSSTNVICNGQNNGSAQVLLTGAGSGSPIGDVGTYTINGGANIAYSGNPFTVSNLAAGNYTISVTTAFGFTDTAFVVITEPSASSSSITVSTFPSYTWAANGQTYTTSGVYTFTTTNTSGCDSIITLNLTILQTSVLMTLQNAVQIAPNVFEYDIMLTNTGTTALALRGYSWGINHATGMANGGTITHSYISRAAVLSTLPIPTFSYTAASLHLRGTTTNATAGNEIAIPAATPIRLATMRVTNTVNFPPNFVPNFSLQLITAAGKTQCIATCITTPPGISYAMNGVGNNPVNGSLQVLSGLVNTPCFYLNNTAIFTATNTSTSSAICFGQTTGTAQMTLTGNGSSAPSGNSGTYSINGGAPISYAGNPFTITNLSAGTNTISVTTSGGCNAISLVTITQQAPINTSSSFSACESYLWNGITYTASATPTHTYIAASGCDSVHTLNLTINYNTSGSSNISSCGSYTLNGNTYTTSGIYTNTFTNSVGCDSVNTLNLIINQSSSSNESVTIANSYTWLANNNTYTLSGVYTFTLTNANGCDSFLTLNLNILSVNISVDQDISCYGNNDGTILAAGVGGSGNYTYDIDGGNAFTNLTGYFFGLAPGQHTICAKETPSNIIICGVVTILEPDPIAANFTTDTFVSCNINNGQLSINLSGGTTNNQPFLTIWTNANGDTLNDQTSNNFATTVGNLAAGNYNVLVEDDNGCTANFSANLATPVCDDTLNLKLFIEGYYLSSSAMESTLLNQGVSTLSNITDSILVELHSDIAPYGLFDSKTTILNTDGTASCVFPALTNSYYIVIKHRNALQTWSANPMAFAGNTTSYDFTTAANKAYGNNMVEIEPGIWSLYAGDLNDDENIDLLDNSILDTDISAFQFGYFATDINGDGNVDLLDSPIVEGNILNFVFASHP